MGTIKPGKNGAEYNFFQSEITIHLMR